MSTRRIVIGRRSNGNKGVFIAPVGVDAYTALDSQLTLGIGGSLAQLVMLGRVGNGSTLIPLGFSHSPYVILTSRDGIEMGTEGTIDGAIRPGPAAQLRDNHDGSFTLFIRGPSYATMNSGGSSMTVTCAVTSAVYQVYNKAWT